METHNGTLVDISRAYKFSIYQSQRTTFTNRSGTNNLRWGAFSFEIQTQLINHFDHPLLQRRSAKILGGLRALQRDLEASPFSPITFHQNATQKPDPFFLFLCFQLLLVVGYT